MSLSVMDLLVEEGGMVVACVVTTASSDVIQRDVIVNLFTTGGSATCKLSELILRG